MSKSKESLDESFEEEAYQCLGSVTTNSPQDKNTKISNNNKNAKKNNLQSDVSSTYRPTVKDVANNDKQGTTQKTDNKDQTVTTSKVDGEQKIAPTISPVVGVSPVKPETVKASRCCTIL